MSWQARISVDPRVLVGKPVVKGTRISVEMVIDLLAAGWTHGQILDSYPAVTEEDISRLFGVCRRAPSFRTGIPVGTCVRFLADENFPRPALQAIRDAGFDVDRIGEGRSGWPDEQVLSLAVAGGRTLLTFGMDFGELAFRHRLPADSGVVLFRLTPRTPEEAPYFFNASTASSGSPVSLPSISANPASCNSVAYWAKLRSRPSVPINMFNDCMCA